MTKTWIKVNLVDQNGSGLITPGRIRTDEVIGYFAIPEGVVPGAVTGLIFQSKDKPALLAETLDQLDELFDNISGERLA